MTAIPLDLYRACKASTWGKKNSQRQSNFIDREGAGSLYPEYEGFERGDGSFRAPDVTTFKDGNGIDWVRGVNDRDTYNNPHVSWKEGVSLSGAQGCFGYSGWLYFLLPKDTPVPASLDVKHTPSRRDPNHYSLRCVNLMTKTAHEGALNTLARSAIAKAVEAGRASLIFS